MANLVETLSLKEDVLRMIQRLPDDCTLEDIQYHLFVRSRVEEALQAMDEGRVYSQDEVERMSHEWLTSSGPTQQ